MTKIQENLYDIIMDMFENKEKVKNNSIYIGYIAEKTNKKISTLRRIFRNEHFNEFLLLGNHVTPADKNKYILNA